ncbi:MAG: AAA family ATPase [Lachnoclostridium sp.]|nr:AAA family ATPase [Lachnoclostridium sp.]
MARKLKSKSPTTHREHIQQLIEWMSQGVYEKEQIIAVALLSAIAGENIFLLGPPGTAKSMVASRLKMVFKDGKSFDYLMSRFSTPDEIFGPISISRLKNQDKYERLTEGYLPEADVVFLDEIWKAGPSIQNTLLTVINEHIFHNGGQIVHTPMKILVAASNELPARDEGLEALWDRFLMRMVSNCIESDQAFFKMLRSGLEEFKPLDDQLYITDELYAKWQEESLVVTISDSVVSAIKALRKALAGLEKEDGNRLRYYVSDRRWRKAYRLMQTSAYLNGRSEIDLTDFMLLTHSFWNDVEAIPNILSAFTTSIAEPTTKQLGKIEKSLRQMMTPQSGKQAAPRPSGLNINTNEFAEYDYFYYLVENYPAGETYFSKWDYSAMNTSPRDAVSYYDTKRKKYIIHTIAAGSPFDAKAQNASGLTKIRVQKCRNGAIIDGTPYSFRRLGSTVNDEEMLRNMPVYQRIEAVRQQFDRCVGDWDRFVTTTRAAGDNIFLSTADLALLDKIEKEVNDQIKATEVKLNNVAMMIK